MSGGIYEIGERIVMSDADNAKKAEIVKVGEITAVSRPQSVGVQTTAVTTGSNANATWSAPTSTVGAYWPYNPWPTATTTTYYVHPERCGCGERVERVAIAVKERKVGAGPDRRRKFTVVELSREALVCPKCGVIAWFGTQGVPT